MLTIPIPFFRASNSGQKWFLCRKHRALKPRFEQVLSAFLHIVVQNFGNNRCSPFQIHSFELLNPDTRGFCTKGMRGTETSLWEGFVSISSHPCPKFSKQQMLTVRFSFFQTSVSSQKWFLCRRHRALNPRFQKVLSAFLHIVVRNLLTVTF